MSITYSSVSVTVVCSPICFSSIMKKVEIPRLQNPQRPSCCLFVPKGGSLTREAILI